MVVCRACNCDEVGSESMSCDATGQCPCRNNVGGLTCNTCSDGSFNLAPWDIGGCQPCYCFGHGTTCTSAAGFMQAVIHSDRSVFCLLMVAGNVRVSELTSLSTDGIYAVFHLDIS